MASRRRHQQHSPEERYRNDIRLIKESTRVAISVLVALVTMAFIPPPPALATSCPEDLPNDPRDRTFRKMIAHDTTWDPDYPTMILGRVVAIRNPKGGREGWAFAMLKSHARPIGTAPRLARVRFWRNPPVGGIVGAFQFRIGGRYVVLAHRRPDGAFRMDFLCGRSRPMDRVRFRSLVRFALPSRVVPER